MSTTQELFEFIKSSPTAFHAADTVRRALEAHGFVRLYEEDEWQILPGKYYVMRGMSSIIAFKIPHSAKAHTPFSIIAAHTDSPMYKLKANYTLDGGYGRLNTEKYGGMLAPTWLDRPLGIAGVITREKDGVISTELYDSGRPVCLIPSVAPHLDRESADGRKLNAQTDLMPLYAEMGTSLRLPEDTVSYDLYVYNREEPQIFGAEGEFICSARIDDLMCVFGTLQGFIRSHGEDNISVLCALDSEEVGSVGRQGADSDFLEAVLCRISGDGYYRALSGSFLVSADNAHALHPNHPELSDETNRPKLNGGIVIKYNANMHYSTDSRSAAVIKSICEKAGVPYSEYANRSDKPGGSTLGNIALTHCSVMSADIGLAQLAMHSAYECAGERDTAYLCSFAESFYNTGIIIEKDKVILK